MKSILIKTSVLSCLFAFGVVAIAQDRDHDDRRNDAYWRGHLFERVRTDLERVQQETPKISPEEFKLAATRHDLDELQSKLASRHYDQPELDRTIASLERVANDRNLSPENRERLQEDLRRLRDFREHHDNYWDR